MESETIGTFDLTCGQCDHKFSGTVIEIDTGQRITSCPACGTNLVALGIEQ